VTTVVNLLFHTVMPDKAYFGKKDMQQFLILRRMVKDMGWPIEMIGMPTVREPDGLAMSSRNAYLTEEERAAASLLYRSLLEAKEAFGQGEKSPEALTDMISRKIETEPLFRKDYIELVRKEDLKTPAEASPDDVIALAAYLGKARLIDNIEL
jgi:pantoate--beta-alanine ligase